MKEGFINFSRLQLNEAPMNPVAVEKQGSEAASAGGQNQRDGTNRRREAQGLQMAAKTGSPTQSSVTQKNIAEHLKQIQDEKELIKLREASRYDWRKELSEELGDDPEEPEHPYIKVMPHIKYKEIEAAKELAAAAKNSRRQKESASSGRNNQ